MLCLVGQACNVKGKIVELPLLAKIIGTKLTCQLENIFWVKMYEKIFWDTSYWDFSEGL